MAKMRIEQDFAFYGDEAGITQDRFTVVGGLCLSKDGVETVYDTIRKYRIDENMHAELKWSKISNQKERQYQKLIELFFALNNTNRVQFHCLIFDNHTWNHNKYKGSDNDIGLSKLYYQLLLHKFVKRCAKHGSLFACLDRRSSKTPLHELRNMINRSANNKLNVDGSPLKQLISRDSKQDDILQFNDVILGAVCAARNGRHLIAGGKTSKKYLAKLVLDNSGLKDFSKNSDQSVQRFTVWNFESS